MNKMKIFNGKCQIGEIWFNKEERFVWVRFNKDYEKQYQRALEILVSRIIKKGYADLIFDEAQGLIKHADERLLLALKQELLLALGLIIK